MGLAVDRVLSEYDEDTAHSDADIGQYVLTVVSTSRPSGLTDQDYSSMHINGNGELYTIDTDGNALLTTIDTDTGNIATSVASIDTDTTTIASDTTSIDATLTALSKAEDAGHSSGDQGVMSLAVRNDSGSVLAGTDLDYIPLTTNATGELRTAATFAAPDNTIDAQTVTVGTSEVALPTTPEPGRDTIIIQNLGAQSIFVGPTGVATSTGLEISKRSSLELTLGPSVAVFGISGTAGQDVRVFETA